jgi:hypothetical protein
VSSLVRARRDRLALALDQRLLAAQIATVFL